MSGILILCLLLQIEIVLPVNNIINRCFLFMGRIKIIQSYPIYYINVLALSVVKSLVLQYTAYNIYDLHFKKLHRCNRKEFYGKET
nr:MAG TPA: hypothetical protein [Caudoviricetes sp.]